MRFDLNAIAGNRHWHTVSRNAPALAGALLLAVAAWQAAVLTWTIVETATSTPALPPAQPLSIDGESAAETESMDRVAGMHLFGTADVSTDTLAAAAADAPETRLNLKLRGVLAASETGLSRAVISSGSDEKVYAVGAVVPGGATVEAVLADRVLLRRDGRLETLRLPRDGVDEGISYTEPEAREETPVEPADFGQMREEIIDNPTRLSELLRYSPVLEGGQIRGYRIYPGRDRASFAGLGLQPGDIVTAINGSPLSDPGRAMELMNNMTDQSNVILTIERNGTVQDVTLSPSR